MFEYKGYRAEIEFDKETDYWCGWLYGISDFVTFGGKNKIELEKDFHDAVDEYLEYCDEIGVEPKHEVSNNLNLKLNSKLYKSLTVVAQNAGESLNDLIEKILNEYVEKTV